MEVDNPRAICAFSSVQSLKQERSSRDSIPKFWARGEMCGREYYGFP